MAYATYEDVEARLGRELTETEQQTCGVLLDDAAVMIDAVNANAPAGNKKIVSCRMVIRALGSDLDVPIGATQGSMAGLGYSQSWTMQTGTSGELYLGKEDRRLLGASNKIGIRSPLEDLDHENNNG